ncbi:cell division cycle protein 20 homolog isoform X2 [Dysidea avara]|uniref:cell division cycle protein 20 homolog isoform X2 n=1 Tax=Dysidea avara TaxID=196820 RepID=UPI00331C313B
MAESDASRLVQLSKSIQAPTPKWHKTVKTCTPRLATPQTLTGGKPVAAYTSTEKHRVGKGYSSHRHHHDKSTRSSKLEKEDGDRFIPNRTLTDLNYASHQMLHGEDAATTDEEHKSMYEFGSSCKRKVKGIQPPSSGRALSTSRKAKVVRDIRKVPSDPEKILDAPGLVDDFYISPLAWSMKNQLSIALGNLVYLWNADDGSVIQLMELSQSSEYISSVSWGKKGAYLAVGTSSSRVQIWDVNKQQKLRDLKVGNSVRIGCSDWNSFILASGCEDGTIYLHDVRQKEALITQVQHHSMEVCGLKWASDGRFLASGSNDNNIFIWNLPTSKEPVNKLSEHTSAVKALSWCPWNSNILASGGGNNDRTIKLWNVLNATCQRTVDVESPVSERDSG